MRIIKFIDKLLNFIVIMFVIIVIAFAGYAFYDIHEVYNESKLSDDIIKFKPGQYQEETAEKFNLADLQKNINEDICGWIRIDDTNIDYPILFPHTSLEYLDKDYKKNYTPGGSIFIDNQNDRYFKDNYTVIYGHNMDGNTMFSDVKLFKEKDFFEKHKGGKLYTGEEVYDIKIYTFNILDSNKDIAYRVGRYKNGHNSELIANFEKSLVFKNDIKINPEDQLIILTTCNSIGTSERAVLFCKIEKSGTTGNINDETNSDIERDSKKKEKELFEQNKEIESKKNIGELTRENYKNNVNKVEKGFFEDIRVYFVLLINDPVRLSLYILIFMTIAIYIILIIKKRKQKKKKKEREIAYTKTEKVNRRRINILRRKHKIEFKENSNVAKNMFKFEKIIDVSIVRRSSRRRKGKKGKGKHSK